MGLKTLRFEEPEQGIGLIVLDRPDQLNALNFEMLEDLKALFHQLCDNEAVRVLIITGKGRSFCAGADLKDLQAKRAIPSSNVTEYLFTVQRRYSDRILEMRRLPQPIIAAVNGPAVGGGMSMALASDVILAVPSAVFIPAFINLGLSACELGSSFFLPRAVGCPRAAEILFTGRIVQAEEAERIGLISRLVKEEDLMRTAIETARILLGKSASGLRLTKETFNQNLNAPSLEAAMEFENRTQSICSFIPEFIEAIENFSKRSKKSVH